MILIYVIGRLNTVILVCCNDLVPRYRFTAKTRFEDEMSAVGKIVTHARLRFRLTRITGWCLLSTIEERTVKTSIVNSFLTNIEREKLGK